MDKERAARYCLLTGGVFWGLYWIPLKRVEDTGLSGAAPSSFVFAAAMVMILPLVAWRWRTLLLHRGDLCVAGLLAGASIGLFTASLTQTEIVRAILLFYLTPVWSTALGMVVLGHKPTVARFATLALGLIGLCVVLGIEDGLPWPRNIGDAMALISGIGWSLASLKLYRMPPVPVPDLIIAFVAGCAFVTGVLFLLSGGSVKAGTLGSAAPWIIFTALYIVPTLAMTLWPATLLTPARAGLLLMTEVVAGVVSAALLSGEPFGGQEVLGTILITAALLSEVFRPERG
ncbi:MAG: DMT family transporter [Silicimonas sp.]|nr:DMT family transporter [Silicimonas sp.]